MNTPTDQEPFTTRAAVWCARIFIAAVFFALPAWAFGSAVWPLFRYVFGFEPDTTAREVGAFWLVLSLATVAVVVVLVLTLRRHDLAQREGPRVP